MTLESKLRAARAVIDESAERAERIRSDHALADLARAYCAAWQSNKDAEPCDWESRRARLDLTLFELLVACGYAEMDVELGAK